MSKNKQSAARRKKKGDAGPNGAGEKVKDYRHEEKRPNNPPAGLATYDKTLPSRKVYDYDPHLDPQLVWAGKKEHASFEVENVALHIHERISTAAIVRAVQREPLQRDFFADPQFTLTEQIEFYQHEMNWANRLILGDSLLVMNSLLERELMAGKVQMIYMDPPYGVKFSSNFQPRIDRRDVKDSDEDLTREPEMIKAYRDTWTLGIHSYLTYLRDRLLLCRELLADSGSIFVQISDENLHHVREALDEIFGPENFVSLIAFTKTTGFSGRTLSSVADYILWYGKNSEVIKYRQLYKEKRPGDEGATKYKPAETFSAIPEARFGPERLATLDQLTAQGASATDQSFQYLGGTWRPPSGMHWKTTVDGMKRLADAGRLVVEGNSLRYVRFLDDFPVFQISNIWEDVGGIQERMEGKIYVVQTATLAV